MTKTKTKNNVICVLCNNILFLDTLFKNYPQELSEFPLLIVNEIRIGNLTNEIKSVCDKHGIKARVIGSDEINEYCKSVLDLTDEGLAFLENYNMGMNILVQLYVFGKSKSIDKLLFLDDDIILSEGVVKIFEEFDRSAFVVYRFNAGPSHIPEDKQDTNIAIYYRNVFALSDIKLDNETWVKHHINGGHRLLCRTDFDLDIYKGVLNRFFNSPFFAEKWDFFKTTGRNKAYGFYQDQNVESMAYQTMGIVNNDLGKYVVLFVSHPRAWDNIKRFVRKPIFHNATVSHKNNLLKYLKMRGEIK